MGESRSSLTPGAPQFILRSNGILYGGWTSLSVTRSMEQLAHSFQVELANLWIDLAQHPVVPIKRGQAVQVTYYNGSVYQDVTNGFVDETTLHYDKDSRTIGFSGRSLTCDLVDCAAIWKTSSIYRSTVLQIAQNLCTPFTGINVGVGFNPSGSLQIPIPVFQISDGETVAAALERACRMRGLVMTTDNTGALILTQVGTTKIATSLVFGQNILECDSSDSFVDRFSKYIVKAQSGAGGLLGNTNYGPAVTQSQFATDPDVLRYRPTIVSAETGEVGVALQNRANWEASVRMGRANRVTYTVDGWEHSQGLWQPNTLVHVHDPQRQLDDDLLIVTVTATRNDDGTHTQLELCPPIAFVPNPLPTIVGGKTGLMYGH